jgi:hypothetical protein
MWCSQCTGWKGLVDQPRRNPGGLDEVRTLDTYGIAKDVELNYSRYAGIQGVAGARQERLHQLLTQGWYVYYNL